mmetsp:Transcript_63625/g.99071  ORF Transcript_63625/g.99071 Transcript_63625/m.99071 type:complete len:454 (+) Transcript_63625:65-1426(+)
MEVVNDLSTKRPLLDDTLEVTPSTENGVDELLPRVSQQSWRFGGSGRRQRANYGRLEDPETLSGLRDEEDDGDDIGAETELLGRIEDGFYECEEEAEDLDDDLAASIVALEESAVQIRTPSPELPVSDHALVEQARSISVLDTIPNEIEFRSAPIHEAPSSSSSSSLAVSVVDVRDLRLNFLANRRRGSSTDEDEAPADVEMRSLVRADSPRLSPTGGVLTSPISQTALPSARGRAPSSIERYCFICLDDDKDTPLTSCCTTCFAAVHVGCWREWRNNQRITALRSRLLGLRMQTNHLLRCTICKSGTALVAGEEDGLEWMNELLCGSGDVDEGARGIIGHTGQMRRDESDEDGDAQLEDLVDMRTCLALVVYLGVLLLVLLIACVLIVMQRFYAGDVILSCIIILYELSVLQIVALAIARRRGMLSGSAAQQRTPGNVAAVADLERGVELVS